MSVESLCGTARDARSLRLGLLEEFRRRVRFDAYAWLLTDPVSMVATSPIADVPCLPELPKLIRLKYATPVNRWTTQSTPVATLHAGTGGQLDRSDLWRDLLADHGVTDVASVVFGDRANCWAFLDLWRVGGVFTDPETRILEQWAPVVTDALRRCVAATFAQDVTERPGGVAEPVVLLLTGDLDVRAQTPATERYLRTLVPPDGPRPPVPAAAYNVGAQLLAAERGVDDRPPMARVHLAGNDWVTLRAARIDDGVAVTIETSTAAERLDLFCRSAGLSVRETELVELLATGADTTSVAQHMFVSPHTVQDHLKSIFAKTGTSSRRELLARIGRL